MATSWSFCSREQNESSVARSTDLFRPKTDIRIYTINIMESWSSSECLASDTESSEPRIPKKKKYCQTYCKQWESQIKWLASSSKGDQYGFCTTCNKHLSCSEGGLKDLKRHGESETHTKLAKAGVGQQSIINFIIIIPLTCYSTYIFWIL